MKTDIRVRGAFRLQLEENGAVVGDSGWVKNQITNEGKLNFLVRALGGIASSSQVGYVAIGTGAAPASNATSLSGEITDASNSRKAVSASTTASSQVAFYATLASSSSHVTATNGYNISNIGLFAISNVTSGTLFAGNTFASSSWAVAARPSVPAAISTG